MEAKPSFLSTKQIIFRDFLAAKLGFLKDGFLSEYLFHLERSSSKFKVLGAKKKVKNEYGENVPENPSEYCEYKELENFFIPNNFSSVDHLSAEVNLKRNLRIKKKEINLQFISATDIGSYTYCPVSYAINKSFDVDKLEAAIVGTFLHEKRTLIDYFENTEPSKPSDEVIEKLNTNQNLSFFSELKKSRLIFNGHQRDAKSKVFFKSTKGNFIGQPDYIFQNKVTDEYYVVEEKFQIIYLNHYSRFDKFLHEKKRSESRHFFRNHKNQLLSYIHGINDYNLKFGYLVYWKYQINDEGPIVVTCQVLKLEKDDQTLKDDLKECFKSLSKFINAREEIFDITKRNPAKCASCVVNAYCGHKTGQFDTLTLPYHHGYLKTYYAPFPVELNKT